MRRKIKSDAANVIAFVAVHVPSAMELDLRCPDAEVASGSCKGKAPRRTGLSHLKPPFHYDVQ